MACIDEERHQRQCEQRSPGGHHRSRSGKSQSGGSVYFDDHGEITGKKWEYNNRPYNDNTPICVGERIQKKVKGALYVDSII